MQEGTSREWLTTHKPPTAFQAGDGGRTPRTSRGGTSRLSMSGTQPALIRSSAAFEKFVASGASRDTVKAATPSVSRPRSIDLGSTGGRGSPSGGHAAAAAAAAEPFPRAAHEPFAQPAAPPPRPARAGAVPRAAAPPPVVVAPPPARNKNDLIARFDKLLTQASSLSSSRAAAAAAEQATAAATATSSQMGAAQQAMIDQMQTMLAGARPSPLSSKSVTVDLSYHMEAIARSTGET